MDGCDWREAEQEECKGFKATRWAENLRTERVSYVQKRRIQSHQKNGIECDAVQLWVTNGKVQNAIVFD
jgi:hypothetical protein